MRRLLICFALLGCHRKPVLPVPAPLAASAPGRGTVFVANDAAAVLDVPVQSVGEAALPELAGAGGQAMLVVGVPVPPAPPREHPPADAVADLLASLTPEARAFVPKASALPFYDIAVRIAPDTGKVAGHVELDWPNTTGAALTDLPLRIFANATGAHLVVTKVTSEGHTATALGGADATLVHLKLSPSVPAGAWVHVGYDVLGQVPLSGVAAPGAVAAQLLSEPSRAPDYGLFARFPGGVAMADWLPMVAARFEDGFDLGTPGTVGDTAFSDVADFRASIELPTEYRLAAAGAVLGEDSIGRTTRTRLALAAGRDLALFASKSFRLADGFEGATRVRVLYENGHATEGQKVLSAARHALSGLADKVTPYPWTQFTAVEVPLGGGAGGAEFSGLVAIAGMFFEPKADVGMGLSFTGTFLDEMREFTVTHEVAHQWWAIQVGSHPRLEPDVDEPLAQATAAMILSPPGGKRDRKEIFDRQVALNYRAMRMLDNEDGPAARATNAFESTTAYAGLVYGKAPLFYEQLALQVGEGAFWSGLRKYAETYRFKTARRGDILTAFEGVIPPARIDALYTHWFGEDHGDVDLADRGDPMAIAGSMFGSAQGQDDSDGVPPNLDQILKSARDALAASAQGKSETQSGEQPLLDSKQAQELLKTLDQTWGGVNDAPDPQ